MTEAYETVIVGGGQAALALSYFLSQLGREHVILERGRVAECWRSERWDSLAFQFPNWSIRLPGYEYRGGDPDGFASRDEVVRFIEQGDQGFTAFTRSVDDFVLRTGMDAPEDVQVSPSHPGLPEPDELDLHAAAITSVVWATGFRYDLGWIRLPVLDEAGEPVHRRGVTHCPGLYFLGLAWLHKLKSSVLCGVGEDAAYLVERIAEPRDLGRPQRTRTS